MSRDRFVVYVLLTLILMSVFGVAFIVLSNKHQREMSLQQKDFFLPSSRAKQQPVSADYDFTAMLPDTPRAQKPAAAQKPTPSSRYEVKPVDSVALRTPQAPSYTPVAEQVPVSHRDNAVQTKFSNSYDSRPSVAQTKVSSPSFSYTGKSFAGGTVAPANQSIPAANPQKQSADDILGEYSAAQTYQEQKALAQKLADMSAGVDKAIFDAMRALGSQNQNMESSTQTTGQDGSATTSTAAHASSSPGTQAAANQISRQLAAQAQQIVGNMRRNYGDQVAGAASEIMNEFQQEMAAVLNSNLPPGEKMVQAQKINNKHNAKLQRLNNQAAKSKMQQQLQQEKEAYLKQVTEMYGPEVAGKMQPILEENWQKRSEIYSAGYSDDEMIKRLQELTEKQNEALNKILVQENNGKGPNPASLDAKQQEDYWKDILQQEQDGKRFARAYRDSEAAYTQIEKGFLDVRAKNEQHFKGDARAQQIGEQFIRDARTLHEQAKSTSASEAETRLKFLDLMKQANQQYQELDYNKQDEANLKDIPSELRGPYLNICREINHQKANLPIDGNYQKNAEQLDKEKQQRITALFHSNEGI